MARIKYLTRADSPNQAIFDRLERERKVPTANIFLALTQTPELLDGFLTYANALRSSPLSPRLRELAILTVGHLARSEYEIAHHQSHALKAGLTQAQIDAVPQFEGSALFTPQEKAVMAFAKESTLKVDVADASWRAVAAFLSEPELIALVLVVAWYNSGVRIMAGLDIELEEDHR
ncbi:MAG: carboxymuconolactone decarboxylase family protein [Betaproteobacteria bacterium]|nr:MAG: carboxymuconolactone decarboxylase family protein [Betaproteobacteria bacterium]